MLLFTIATMTPFALIFAAMALGGVWGWIALGYITVLVFLLDRLVAARLDNPDPDAAFSAADHLLKALAGLHFLLMLTALWAVGGESGLDLLERALVAISAALVFGQISHPVAHELIHRPARRLRLLGRLVYTSLLFGHHATAHLRVHHVHVGSKADPNSARWGEGFWRFFLRSWPGGFLAGWAVETERHAGRPRHQHPYLLYVGGAFGMALLSLLIAGLWGLAVLVFMALYAQIQILLSDYVQHYGLRRKTRANGKLEPVGPQHSWNAPHYYSSAMTLNAPRHSDHHVTPGRPYPALQMDAAEMPTLPYSLPVMAVLALVPPLWRRIMDPLCARWQQRSNGAEGNKLPKEGEALNTAGVPG